VIAFALLNVLKLYGELEVFVCFLGVCVVLWKLNVLLIIGSFWGFAVVFCCFVKS
jgi:hypothetical protein